MTTPISFPLAKLLKEKGFDKECWNYYTLAYGKKPYITQGIEYQSDAKIKFDWNCNNEHSKGIQAPYPNTYHISQCSAPTIAEVVMWLYEKHGIWIEVTTNNNPQVRKEFVSFNARVIHRDRNIKFRVLMNTQINKYTEPFNSPTEAYEAAIEYILNNLI